MKIDPLKTVFVFDLDDTLYQESTFLSSGLDHIKKLVKRIYKNDINEYINSLNILNDDFLGLICKHLKLPNEIKFSLLWEYRLHMPTIKLNSGVNNFLSQLENLCTKIVILTDGRSITQRNKLLALGLNHLPVYISEEYAETKLDIGRFEKIEQNYPAKYFIYVGDNPNKDFFIPNKIGWITFGVLAKSDNIHSQDLSFLDKNFHPHYWIDELNDLGKFLC